MRRLLILFKISFQITLDVSPFERLDHIVLLTVVIGGTCLADSLHRQFIWRGSNDCIVVAGSRITTVHGPAWIQIDS